MLRFVIDPFVIDVRIQIDYEWIGYEVNDYDCAGLSSKSKYPYDRGTHEAHTIW